MFLQNDFAMVYLNNNINSVMYVVQVGEMFLSIEHYLNSKTNLFCVACETINKTIMQF